MTKYQLHIGLMVLEMIFEVFLYKSMLKGHIHVQFNKLCANLLRSSFLFIFTYAKRKLAKTLIFVIMHF